VLDTEVHFSPTKGLRPAAFLGHEPSESPPFPSGMQKRNKWSSLYVAFDSCVPKSLQALGFRCEREFCPTTSPTTI
jgi:hypothetical protein